MKGRNVFTVLIIILIIVSLILAGCIPPTEENVSLVNTVVVSRTLPTQTPHPATLLPSATPSITLTPTPTIHPTTPTATLTVQPTPTKTPIPIPTVEDMEVTQQVLWLFETNNGCQLPCWWGITPGQTEWQTAQEFLSVFDSNIREISIAVGFTYYGVDIPLPAEAFLAENLELGVLVRDGMVEQITTDVTSGKTPPGYLTQYTFPTFLNTYGPPSEVWLFTYDSPFEEDDLPFVVTLFYADLGIVALYGDNAELQEELVRGCPQENPMSFLSLWSPDLNLTFEQVINGTSALERNYLSLEESTGMSVTTFYETFVNPENAACLETPAKFWR